MLTGSLPPILESSEAGTTEPGLHSSRGREGGRGERWEESFLLLCSGSLLSGGSMGRLILRADMAMLYVGQQTVKQLRRPQRAHWAGESVPVRCPRCGVNPDISLVCKKQTNKQRKKRLIEVVSPSLCTRSYGCRSN